MLIIHLIGSAILLASLSLKMSPVSSTLSLLFTNFKSMSPVTRIQQREDVPPISATVIASPSFHSDVVPSPIDFVDYSQYPDLGYTTRMNGSADSVVQEVVPEEYNPPSDGDDKPVSDPTTYFNVLLLLASLFSTLILYLVYVSLLRKYPSTSSEGYSRQVLGPTRSPTR